MIQLALSDLIVGLIHCEEMMRGKINIRNGRIYLSAIQEAEERVLYPMCNDVKNGVWLPDEELLKKLEQCEYFFSNIGMKIFARIIRETINKIVEQIIPEVPATKPPFEIPVELKE